MAFKVSTYSGKWLMMLLVITICYATTFIPCEYGIYNNPCSMTCEATDLTKTIIFKRNGSTRGTCVSSTTCIGPGLQTQMPNTVILTIASLSYSNDIGSWTCSYDGVDASPSPFIVYGNSTRTNVTSTPNPSQVKIEKVSVFVEADCVYPANPSLKLSYRLEGTNDYKVLLESQVIGKTATPGHCNDGLETIISENREVIGRDYPDKLPGKTVYFKLELFQTLQNAILLTTDYGPFSFQGCGFSVAGFSTFLIELAAFIVIMILLKLEKIGGFTKLKVCVSCAFLGVALIIGITLGFVLQECDKNNLSIGLGIGLGCLLAAAHIVTVYVIHKKCEDAKKHDDERKGTPASTSNVKITDRKATHVHLGTINGNKVDSQPKEPLRPLPVPPAIHPKQLEPIVSVPDDGAPSSEKKKKKKKKKKKSEARGEPEDQ